MVEEDVMGRILRFLVVVIVSVVAVSSCAMFNNDLFAKGIGTWTASSMQTSIGVYNAPADFSDTYVINNDHTWTQSGSAPSGSTLAAGGTWSTYDNWYWLSYSPSAAVSVTYSCKLSTDAKTLTVTWADGTTVETCSPN
jgi:hypothetical protein